MILDDNVELTVRSYRKVVMGEMKKYENNTQNIQNTSNPIAKHIG